MSVVTTWRASKSASDRGCMTNPASGRRTILGFVFGPVVMGAVAEVGGLRLAFLTLTSLALLLAAAGFVTLRIPGAAQIAVGHELLRTGRG